MPIIGPTAVAASTALPAGGAAGQVLSTTGTGLAWTTAASPGPVTSQLVSGGWFDNRRSGSALSPSAGQTYPAYLNGSTTYYLPFWLPRAISVTAMALYLSSAFSAYVDMGVYASDGTALGGLSPGTLLGSARVAANAAAGAVTFTPATAIAVPAGWAWFAVRYSSATGNITVRGTNTLASLWPWPGVYNAAGPASTSLPRWMYVTGTGSLTATAPAGFTFEASGENLPIVYVKIA